VACPRPSSELRSNQEASLLGKCVYFVRLEFALRMEQTAVIKETLRMAATLPAGLPRVVPPSGAVISGVEIPGGVRVSCPSVFGFT
jgi:cytochrome P450